MDSVNNWCQKLLFACTRLHSEDVDLQLVRQLLADIEDKQTILQELEKNGLAPLFYSHVRHHTISLGTEISLATKALVLRHQSVVNARYQAVKELSEVFLMNGIPWVALKGLALASSLYDHAEQRPMRDMDVLVPRKNLNKVSEIMRSIGYALAEQQPSKYMRGTHQLPNAEKQINGFKISVEIHHNAISQDAYDSLTFEDVGDQIEGIQWRDLSIPVLPKAQMMHQLCRHLEALHPEGNLKLINVLDVVGFADKNRQDMDWQYIQQHYPHILNTLRCLNYITPLSQDMNEIMGEQKSSHLHGVGKIMLPLTSIFSTQYGFFERLRLLFLPSDWWLHLYYGVHPDRSLLLVKFIRHPLRLGRWLFDRLISRLQGG